MTHGSDLDSFFRPRGVAVVGASGRANSPFARPLQYLLRHGYSGDIYPINPNYETLDGVKCFASFSDLPGPIDLALLLVSAAQVKQNLEAAAAAGARAAIVYASGYAEVGPSGLDLQREMIAEAQRLGIRILGPNCQGLVSAHDRLSATFTAGVEPGLPVAGNVAYVGQSGAVGGSVLSLARERGLGIGYWATTGNEADLTALELGRHLIEDERVSVLALYLESAVDGVAYTALVERAAELGVAVAVLRSGRSDSGARAAASHTGAIVGPDAAFAAVSRDYGVTLTDDLVEFISVLHALSVLPRALGKSVGILTTSGGAGSLAADQVESVQLEVPALGEAVQLKLAESIPSYGAVGNPVDVTAQLFRTGEATEFVGVMSEVLDAPEIDALMVMVTLVTNELAQNVAQGIADLTRSATKPVVSVWLVARDQTADARALLTRLGIPAFDSPATAAQVLQHLVAPSRPVATPEREHEGLAGEVAQLGRDVITEAAGAQLLAHLGVPRMAERLVQSAAEARTAASELGEPFVLKIQSPDVLHKTDRGGVVVGVATTDVEPTFTQLIEAFDDATVEGVLVQEQAEPGLELVIGVTNLEPGFPPLISVGFGGITTELYEDVSTRVVPVSESEAGVMLDELRGAQLFHGFRGGEAVDLSSACSIVAALSQLASSLRSQLVELEINPLRLARAGKQTVALDFFMRLQGRTSEADALPGAAAAAPVNEEAIP